VTVYPYFFEGKGSVVPISGVVSKELGNTRDVAFYLPPLILENTLALVNNLLVMHGKPVGFCLPKFCAWHLVVSSPAVTLHCRDWSSYSFSVLRGFALCALWGG
jgi:hypothetical protein